MCECYAKCEYCASDRSECEEMGDGSPFCSGFTCNKDNCNRGECISYEEMYDAFYPGL